MKVLNSHSVAKKKLRANSIPAQGAKAPVKFAGIGKARLLMWQKKR